MLAELISSRRKIPAIFSLAPALGLYLFSSALGTGSWRAVGLALIAGAACWYLVAVVREREAAQDVVIASPDAALSVGERAASYGAGAVMLRMAVLAAVAAAVIGPNLPGAGSQPLVAWHGKGGGGHVTKSTVIPGGDLPQGIEISTLVQVAEEEVDNPDVVLFTVHSVTATREIIATLDTFNGNRWSASSTNGLRAVSSFAPPISTDLHQPPAPVPDGVAQERLVQVFQVALLAGYNLPSWGVPLAVANAGQVTRDGPGGSLVSDTALEQGSIYAVSSQAPDPTSAQLAADSTDNSDPTDVALPAPVPGRIVLLAHSLVAGATTAYQKALDLQDYLTSSRFHYQLPARTKSGGVVTPLPGYGNLLSFLFKTRTGYCQQFATAFAVLARIDGLPTRIAVGFLPGIIGRPRRLGRRRDRHPRLAPGEVRGLRLDRLRADARCDRRRLDPAGRPSRLPTKPVVDPDDLGQGAQPPSPLAGRWQTSSAGPLPVVASRPSPRRLVGTLASRRPRRVAGLGRRRPAVAAPAAAPCAARAPGRRARRVGRSAQDARSRRRPAAPGRDLPRARATGRLDGGAVGRGRACAPRPRPTRHDGVVRGVTSFQGRLAPGLAGRENRRAQRPAARRPLAAGRGGARPEEPGGVSTPYRRRDSRTLGFGRG